MLIPVITQIHSEEFALCVFNAKAISGAIPQLTHLSVYRSYEAAETETRRVAGDTTASILLRDVPIRVYRGADARVHLAKIKSSAHKTGLLDGDRVCHYVNGATLVCANLALSVVKPYERSAHVLSEGVTTIHGFPRIFGELLTHENSTLTAYVQFSDDRVELNLWSWRGEHVHSELQFYPHLTPEGVSSAVRLLFSDPTGQWQKKHVLSQIIAGGYCRWTKIDDPQLYAAYCDPATHIQPIDSVRCFSYDASALEASSELRYALQRTVGKYGRTGVPLLAAWAAMAVIDNHGADLLGKLSPEGFRGGATQRMDKKFLKQVGLGKFGDQAALEQVMASRSAFVTALAVSVVLFGLLGGYQLYQAQMVDQQLAERYQKAEKEKGQLGPIARQAKVDKVLFDWLNSRKTVLAEYDKGQTLPADIVKEVFGSVPFYNNIPLVQLTSVQFENDKVVIEGFTDISKADAASAGAGQTAGGHLPPDLFDPVSKFQQKLEIRSNRFVRVNSEYDRTKPDGSRFKITAFFKQTYKLEVPQPLPIPQLLVDAAGENPTVLGTVAQKQK